MALIVVVVGVLVSLPFQFLVPEKSNVQLKRLQWYRWFLNPRLYLVSVVVMNSPSRGGVTKKVHISDERIRSL